MLSERVSPEVRTLRQPVPAIAAERRVRLLGQAAAAFGAVAGELGRPADDLHNQNDDENGNGDEDAKQDEYGRNLRAAKANHASH